MDENNFENFEKMPGNSGELSGEQAERAEMWESAMSTDVPEFAGEQFGVANESNEYYGETVADGEDEEAYDAGIADAAAIINYGLNAATRELGVETVVQKIKSFDAGNSVDPIGDLNKHLGIVSREEKKELHEENMALKENEALFREGANAPTQDKSREGAFKAIEDMKELIAEVEGADPKYDELRAGARAAGKGYFEYAVNNLGVRGLTELFDVLSAQRKKDEEVDVEEEELAVENGDDADEAENSAA